MSEYHKINSIFKRDMDAPGRPLIVGSWAADEFEYLADNQWIFTEKVDGTNIRVIVGQDGSVTFGGRTDRAQLPADLVVRLQERFLAQSARLAELFPSGAVLYGEGYGPGIQKGGGLYRQDKDFVLFDTRVGDWWLRREAVTDTANALSIDVVPVIGSGTLWEAVGMAQDGITSTWGNFLAEGVVARPLVELRNRAGSRIIAKIKCCDFRGGRV